MKVVEVNHLNTETTQTRLASFINMSRVPVDVETHPLVVPEKPTLGSEHDVLPATRDSTSHKLFVMTSTVHVGGVKKVDAKFKGPTDCRPRFRIVASAVSIRNTHATESNR
jgi:hypothetical protein